ncbi:signal peptidase II [Octadecabacter sp. R77987]|uniref:signal peptidase II n=1 Tax=Octadecabacter sp. R77987 TaxID=3093874 RepID=UPI003670F673
MMKPLFIGLASASMGLLIDQATKFVVVENASSLVTGIKVLPVFDLVFLRNDGVSFGMLGGVPWWGLTVLALIICAFLAFLLFRSDNRVEAVAFGAIIGGALGNVVDRFRFQAVTDFLSFHIGDLYWPAFNLADVFVVCGVAVLLLEPLTTSRRSQA